VISLRIGGVTPFTTVDYPGRLAAVVFCQGCGWRCGYCHNPHLLPRRGAVEVPWTDVERLLERRRGLLDAVVFSGGEPTLQRALPEAVQRARSMGFRVGLHTAGPDPERLARVLPWLDWVALDVKAPFDDYARITGVAGSGRRARESVSRVVRWGGDYECRTTVHARQWTEDALLGLAGELAELGVARYAVQRFRAVGCADDELRQAADEAFPGAGVRERIAGLFASFALR
jgi:pyruvate formate lyase activating enzyme